MAFKPIQYEDGQTVTLPIAAITAVKHDCFGYTAASNGNITKGTASQGTDITHVILENVASTATAGDLKLFLRAPGVVFEVDTNTAPVRSTDVGQYVDLTDEATVNESSGAGDYLFFIEDIVGPTTDKKVRGWFVHGTPNT